VALQRYARIDLGVLIDQLGVTPANI
jgi:hypothetical protein